MALTRGSGGTAVNTITYTSPGGKTERLDVAAATIFDSAGNEVAPATALNQATEIASLASIDGKVPTLGAKTGAGSVSVVWASDQVLPAGANIIGNVRIDQTTPGTTNGVVAVGNVASGATNSGNPVAVGGLASSSIPTAVTTGQRVGAWYGLHGEAVSVIADSSGNLAITQGGSADAQSNTPGQGLRVISYPYEQNGATWDRKRKSNSTGRLLAAANTTNATSVKASAGDLFKIKGKAAAAVFLKLYNKASAPTVGSDTPIMTIALAVGDNEISFAGGHYFSTGIAYAITAAAADADTTAVAANDVTCLNITYA